ncbi:MAG: UDP-N-acetylmuramate dehydrogenase [Anaerolineae bacterium]
MCSKLNLFKDRIEEGKLLRELSTFGIGGPARYFLEVQTIEEMQEAIAEAAKATLPYIVIGKGSNCLFDDRGFDGLCILNKINSCSFKESQVFVGAGYSFSLLGAQTARKGLSGLEFASGIPASVGGAVYMNAGANGKETSDCLIDVTYVDDKGDVLVLRKESLQFSYRYSSFQKMKGAIVCVSFSLTSSLDARQEQLKLIDYRTKTQPYGDKSAGCVFRNPEDTSAGALIEKCGLKGTKVGGAEVSLLHANFIVNKEEATCSDVLELVDLIKEIVKQKMGVELEMEIRRIPYTFKDDV